MENNRKYGLDYFRFIAIIPLIHFHTVLFGPRSNILLYNENYNKIDFSFVYFFIITPCGIFTVFLISIYLAQKKIGSKKGWLKNRLGYLIKLLSFWLIFNTIYLYLSKPENIDHLFSNKYNIINYVLSGGNSHLWYLLSLIFILSLNGCYEQIKRYLKSDFKFLLLCSITFILFVILIPSAPWIMKKNHSTNPLSFIHIVPLLFIIRSYVEKKEYRKRIILFSILIFLFFTILELQSIQIYASNKLLIFRTSLMERISMAIGGFILFFIAINYQWKKNKVILNITSFILPVYILHWYIPFCNEIIKWLDNISIPIWISEIIVTIYRVIFSILVAWAMRKNSFLKKFF